MSCTVADSDPALRVRGDVFVVRGDDDGHAELLLKVVEERE